MLVFCTAIRFSFKGLLENNIKIIELEKIVANKYNLNIRKSKDAVESARQTIQSQKELVKMNYEEYSNKVKAIEKLLNDKTKKLSQKKINDLNSKLEKRQRKLEYFKYFIDNNTIPSVTFGTKVKPQFTSKIGLYKYCHQYGIFIMGLEWR
jgi:predicted transposase